MITLEYPGFYLVNCYTPNSQDGLRAAGLPDGSGKKCSAGTCWDLDAKKPVILCGDLNVAHQEIDIKKPLHQTAGTPALPMRSGPP